MSIKELTSVKQDQRDLDWLKSALQAAVELEFFTIPPYLTAMWSVEEQLPSRAGSNGSDGSADAHAADTADAADAADAQAADAQAAGGEVRLSAAHLLRSIVYEEMEHMALACNMLAAIGGTPRINRGSAVPTYPRPMPGGVNPRLVVALGGLTPESVKTFMEIEQPEKPLQFPTEALVRGETFPR
ncbi:MAG TPA: ferritin-like domain-containing protein, partial [Pirellulales bacterium]